MCCEIRVEKSGREACRQKGLRRHNSPVCTLSQNGYGDVVICKLAHSLACLFAAAMRLRPHRNNDNEVTVVHLAPSSGHCKAFSTTIPPLQVALSFACSVASLSHSPSLQLPGWHSLHRGSLADYLLGWGSTSTCTAGLTGLQHPPMTKLPAG